MNKITKTSTKDEILEALKNAQEEQNLLHEEVTSLQNKIDKLEVLVQEEDVKKKGLIKELASQGSDIELATKKTEKYAEIKATVKSTKEELEAIKVELFNANKKIEVLTSELESFKNRALPSGVKTGFRRFFTFKKFAVASIVLLLSVIYFVTPYGTSFIDKADSIISRIRHNVPITLVNPVAGMTFEKTDGIVTARHNKGDKLQTEDGVVIDDSIIIKWASKAGFDGVLFGSLVNFKNQLDVERIGSKLFEFSEIGLDDIAARFEELGCSNVLALVENKDNLTPAGIFTQTSKGKLEVYESRRKLAGFFPVFWGKEKTQMNIKSDNVYAYITTDMIFMEVKGIKAVVSLTTIEDAPQKELTMVAEKK